MKTVKETAESHGIEPYTTSNSCPGVYYWNQVEDIAETYASQFKPKWIPVTERQWNHGERYMTFSQSEGRRYLQYGTLRNGFPHGVTHVLPNDYLPVDPLPTKP